MNVTFSKGELLQLTSASYVEDSEEALTEYFQTAFPIAGRHGYAPLVKFAITEALSGTFGAQGFIGLYKFPSAASAEAFKADPDLPAVVATRPRVFQQLRNHTTAVEDELTLELDADSAYEIQFLWLSRGNASAYEEYEKAMTEALGEFGGRVVANLAVDSYETLQPWPHQPDKIVILEWPDTTARTGYLSGDGYQRTQPLLHSGVANADSFLTRATAVG